MGFQDGLVKKLEIVDSVSTYLKNIQKLEYEWCDDKRTFMVFRGEDQEYNVPCVPTIYRDFALKQVDNYEMNMFLAMRQDNISNSMDYLHNAIDAQHDGFPSRLLDVSYNCLIALYFATTPYYANKIESMDNKDGFVYVFKFDEVYSPEAQNTKDIYISSLQGKQSIFNEAFFSSNHRLIDHCKQNKRIIAQQGAFILFSGEIPEPIPYHQMCGIRILGAAKARIRHELRSMFGIYTGSVYPEVELMHDEIKEKCLRMNTFENTVGNNINAAIKIWQREYDYFADCCDYFVNSNQDDMELIRLIERSVTDHKFKVKGLIKRLMAYDLKVQEKESRTSEEITKLIVAKYNSILREFIDELPEAICNSIDHDIKRDLEGANDGAER